MNPTIWQRLLSRKFLLTVVSSIAGLALIFWPNQSEKIQQVSTIVGGLLVAIAGAAFVQGEAKVDAARLANQPLVETTHTTTDSEGNVESKTTSKSVSPVILLALLMMLPHLGGCANTTPTKRWATAQDSLSTTRRLLVQASQQGILKPEDVLTIDPFVQSAQRALEVAETQLPAGGDTFTNYMSIVDAVLKRLMEIYAQRAQEEPHAARSNPGWYLNRGRTVLVLCPPSGTVPAGWRNYARAA